MSAKPQALLPLAFLLIGAGCGDGTGPGGNPVPFEDLTTEQQRTIRVGVMALAIAAAEQGASFFDNFLPCPRRGVIDFHNTPNGRQATISGCDMGGGFVVEGSGEVTWEGSGTRELFCGAATQADPCPTAFEWSGQLAVSHLGGSPVQITSLRVEEMVWDAGGGRLPNGLNSYTAGLGLSTLSVTVGGETVTVEDNSLPAKVFDTSGLSISSIPNASESPSALTDADVKRLVYDGGMSFLSFLVNETLETQRGDHSHELSCGTSAITVDPVAMIPHIASTWNQCPLTFGLIVSGTFSIDWVVFDFDTGPIAMVVDGELTMGGAIPVTTMTQLTFTVEGVGGSLDLPGTIRISGVIQGLSDQRPFSFELLVDD